MGDTKEFHFNREQRRKMEKRLKKGILDVDTAISMLERQVNTANAAGLPEGTRVRLNVDQIVKRPDYHKMQDAYRLFVESNADTEFTVAYDEKHTSGKLVLLRYNRGLADGEENPKWLFYSGDLIDLEAPPEPEPEPEKETAFDFETKDVELTREALAKVLGEKPNE